jgi:hypothetical protein
LLRDAAPNVATPGATGILSVRLMAWRFNKTDPGAEKGSNLGARTQLAHSGSGQYGRENRGTEDAASNSHRDHHRPRRLGQCMPIAAARRWK